MTMTRLLVGSALHLGLCIGAAAAEPPPEAPKPASRTDRVIEGWKVRIDDRQKTFELFNMLMSKKESERRCTWMEENGDQVEADV